MVSMVWDKSLDTTRHNLYKAIRKFVKYFERMFKKDYICVCVCVCVI